MSSTWNEVYEESGYLVRTLCGLSGIDEGSFRKYLKLERTPSKANLAKMERVMFTAKQLPRLKFHPSYGYATEQQIQRLKELPKGAEFDGILKEIAEQTRNRGKFK